MITKKELQFVDYWANRIPMPGKEYSIAVLNELKECVKLYNEHYKNKAYNIHFSSGEEIDFRILESNLCHMLGIDYKNIKKDYFDYKREKIFGTSANDFSSYQLLELILEHADEIVENDNDVNVKAKFINYYKSQIKSEIFKKMSEFDEFNFGMIDKEDKKSFYVESNESMCPYFLTCIKKEQANLDSELSDTYFVTSLVAVDDPATSFENGIFSIPTQIIVSDNNNLSKKIATPEEKIHLLTVYKNIINKYRLPFNLDIFEDYEDQLNAQKIKTLNCVQI